jgi:Undecaprenyl-phosphate glucose phosphotransferase
MTSSHAVDATGRTGTGAPAYPIAAAPRRNARPLDRRLRAGEIRRDRRAEDGRPRTGSAPTPTEPATHAAGETIEPPRHRLDPRAVHLAVRAIDAALLIGAGIASYCLRPEFPLVPSVAHVLVALAVVTVALRPSRGEPLPIRDVVGQPRLRLGGEAIMRTLAPFALALIAVLLLQGFDNATFDWLATWAVGAACAVLCIHLVAAGRIARWHAEGRFKRTVAIFGTGDLAARLLERLHATCADSIELVGVFDDRRRAGNLNLQALVCGRSRDLIELSRRRLIDRVIVALPHSAERRLVEVLRNLHQMPVEISLAPDMVGFSVAGRDSAEFGGLPLIDVYGQPLSFGQNLAKGAFDKIIAALALIVAAPVMLACAIAIKLDSKGPVLFCQPRLGFGDRVIRVFKFRSMYHEDSDVNCERQSSRDDPRITRVGRFLRKSSLDELPQLFNVLRGEMSLVGPRPHAIAMQVEQRRNEDIVPDYALRHHVKPGITGWAQVNGYNGPVDTVEALRARVAHDLDYINNWSLWFDIRSLLLTIKVFLGQRHVY